MIKCSMWLKKALEFDYRHIDCAWIYQNEKYIENVLNDQIKKGQLKRSIFWNSDKTVVRNNSAIHHHIGRAIISCVNHTNWTDCLYIEVVSQ